MKQINKYLFLMMLCFGPMQLMAQTASYTSGPTYIGGVNYIEVKGVISESGDIEVDVYNGDVFVNSNSASGTSFDIKVSVPEYSDQATCSPTYTAYPAHACRKKDSVQQCLLRSVFYLLFYPGKDGKV